MRDTKVQDLVTALNSALARSDLTQAQRHLERLRGGIGAISPAELQALRASMSGWLQQATQLRAGYARDLRGMLRRRQNLTAYHDVGNSQTL